MAISVNVVCYCHTDQRRIEPETDPHKHVQITFDKDRKAIQWRKDDLSANVDGTIGHPLANKNELQPKFTPYTKINSKWIAELNVIIEPQNSQEKNGKSSGPRVR